MSPDAWVVAAELGFVGIVVLTALLTRGVRRRELQQVAPDMAIQRTGFLGTGGLAGEYRGARLRVFGTMPLRREGDGPPALSDAARLTVLQQELLVPLPGRLLVMRDILMPRFLLRNLTDVKLGDAPFDETFLVEESAPGLAERVLTARVREAILELQRRSSRPLGMRSSGLALTIAAGTMFVSLEETSDSGILSQAMEVVRAVVDTLCGVDSRPALRGPAGPGEAHCLVCGGALAEEPLLACTKCGTQHHRACLEYLGRCAVFGCDARARE